MTLYRLALGLAPQSPGLLKRGLSTLLLRMQSCILKYKSLGAGIEEKQKRLLRSQSRVASKNSRRDRRGGYDRAKLRTSCSVAGHGERVASCQLHKLTVVERIRVDQVNVRSPVWQMPYVRSPPSVPGMATATVEKARSVLERIVRKRFREEWFLVTSSVAGTACALLEVIGCRASLIHFSTSHTHIGLQHRVLMMWVTRSTR